MILYDGQATNMALRPDQLITFLTHDGAHLALRVIDVDSQTFPGSRRIVACTLDDTHEFTFDLMNTENKGRQV